MDCRKRVSRRSPRSVCRRRRSLSACRTFVLLFEVEVLPINVDGFDLRAVIGSGSRRCAVHLFAATLIVVGNLRH